MDVAADRDPRAAEAAAAAAGLPADGSPVARNEPLAELLAQLQARPGAIDLFQLLRRIDALQADKPRLGDAIRPADEPIRFNEEATLTFAVAAIVGAEPGAAGVPRVTQRVIGFLGPNGALPTHLTEFARERVLHHKDRTFVSFLNMLLHRFGLLFYKAWARANPVVELDRPRDARVVRHIGALVGLHEPALRERDALGDFAKLHMVGRLSRSVRDADGLEAWIALQFGVPVRVEQFVGHWMPLERSERSRLRRDGQHGLGRGAVLGGSVWDVQHKFRIVVGPLRWERFEALLPGSDTLDRLQALVRQYVGFEFAWDLRLILERRDVPAWSLGRRRGVGLLGRSAWIASRPGGRPGCGDADELVMNVESIRRAPMRPSLAAASLR